MTEIGPVQMIAVGFGPDAQFEGKVLEELAKLEDEHTIRVLDLLFILHQEETGQYEVMDYHDEDLGAIVAALMGLEFEGGNTDGAASGAPQDEHAFGLSRTDLDGLKARIEPGQAAAFMLIEHVWARDLKRAIRGAGGVPLGDGFLTPELIASVGPELTVVSQALDEKATQA
jgi:uncharacterized membrane protein